MLRRIYPRLARPFSLMRSGALRLVGFALSVVLLAAASLLAIPAMIAASGEAAWGAIALGQVVGTVGGVAVGYGWGWFGPARIAGSRPPERRTEYLESVIARGTLALPVCIASGGVAYLLASSTPIFAAAGAVSATCMGLSASWYFVGLSRPFTMLVLETLPRAAGTGAAVLLMMSGHSALMGPLGMMGGLFAALAVSSVWILRETTPNGGIPVNRRPLRLIYLSNRHGIASALGSASYLAAPLAIVSVVAPNIQPAFALADRVKGLVFVASAPAASLLQGWVPRAKGSDRARRANIAIFCAGGFAVILGIATAALARELVNWLSNSQISISWMAAFLMASCVSVTLFQNVLERAALAAFDKLRASAVSVAIGSALGLPMVGLGAHYFGTEGALGGVLLGLVVCVGVELTIYLWVLREMRRRGGFHGPVTD
jgi:hypothetical protein